MVPAVKFPDASRATIAEAVFALVAVVALFGIDVSDAPEPENVVAVTVPVTLNAVSPVKDVTAAPRATAVEPMVTDELVSPTVIEPAPFVIVMPVPCVRVPA
jgi:hypothetical protein